MTTPLCIRRSPGLPPNASLRHLYPLSVRTDDPDTSRQQRMLMCFRTLGGQAVAAIDNFHYYELPWSADIHLGEVRSRYEISIVQGQLVCKEKTIPSNPGQNNAEINARVSPRDVQHSSMSHDSQPFPPNHDGFAAAARSSPIPRSPHHHQHSPLNVPPPRPRSPSPQPSGNDSEPGWWDCKIVAFVGWIDRRFF